MPKERRSPRHRAIRRIARAVLRHTFWGLALVVMAVVVVGLVAKIARPYREIKIQLASRAATARQINMITAENRMLRRRKTYLQTPEGMAQEARKMGYVRPGEIPIVVEADPSAPAPN